LLKHHCQQSFTISPIAETPLHNNFFPPSLFKTLLPLSSHFLIDETTPSNNCFAFSFLLLKHHCQQLFTIFPIAETPFTTTFRLLPIAKTLQSTILHFLHRRNNTVQQLFRPIFPVAETPLFNSSSHFLINETTPSNNCFAPFFSVAETPTFQHYLSASFYALIL
jgi:hypothetical protein